MVVLSAAVTNKAGKPLVARQFVEMTRLRIEGLLAAFPKLMGTERTQHTFIDTDNVRYVYQPLDQLYLLLITNKASNILEDLDTVRLLSRVVTDLGGTTEDAVSSSAFDIVFAFDEVITTGGYREAITLPMIRTNLEMESHEEKLHMMIQQSKQDTAREEMRRKQKEIGIRNQQGGGRMAGIGGGGDGMGGGGGMGGMGSSMPPMDEQRTLAPEPVRRADPSPRAPVIKSSMKLGGAAKGSSLMASLAAEDNLTIQAPAAAAASASSAAGAAAAAAPAAAASTEPVTLGVEEKVSVTLNREGGLESMEVKGSLALTAHTEEARNCRVHLALGANASSFTFQCNPKISKGPYESSQVLELKNPGAGFPLNRAAGVLRWLARPTGDQAVPFSINCWPEEEGGGVISVNIEYALQHTDLSLHNVEVTIPLDSSEVPAVGQVDGNFRHDPRQQTITWVIDHVDASNASGSLEFTIRSRDTEAFFPVGISYATMQSAVDLDVQRVEHLESGATVPHQLTRSQVAENYSVV